MSPQRKGFQGGQRSTPPWGQVFLLPRVTGSRARRALAAENSFPEVGMRRPDAPSRAEVQLLTGGGRASTRSPAGSLRPPGPGPPSTPREPAHPQTPRHTTAIRFLWRAFFLSLYTIKCFDLTVR